MPDLSHTEFLYFVYRHTDYTFAIERARVAVTDLTYLISGEMTYLHNDEEIHLHAGDAILIPQGSIRERRETPTPVRYASINVRLPEDFTFPFAGYLPGRATPAILPILKLMEDARHAASEYSDRQCLALFAYLYYQLAASEAGAQSPYIGRIKCYISEHLSEKLTLHDISAAVHLTPEYCCSVFKKHTGQTVFDYILTQRIDTAKRLITLGDMPLRAIAAEMGFADYNYFSRTFKRLTGLTPRAFKALSGSSETPPLHPRPID